MKEFTESVLLAFYAKLITKTEAKELFIKAANLWFEPSDHVHEGDLN